jgi:hypothetical protein
MKARERWQVAQNRLAAATDRPAAAAALQQARLDGLTGALQRDAGQVQLQLQLQLQQELDRARRECTTLVLAFHTCFVIALGVDLQGNKIPLALVEGATENATLVTSCWSGCVSGGWV